ncbi:MAG: PorV/PorQ family protein [Ignavibacteriales bacterium]|nr:PorV/PorQ family protein [Ignavibacteriales bacterium]
MRPSYSAIPVLVVVMLATAPGQVTKTGTTAAKFLSIGIGARANGMGGAFSSVADDASALYWNPAGAASLSEYHAMVTYTSLFKDLDINLNYLALVLPAGDFGNFGLSAVAIDYGKMDVTTELRPEGTGERFSAISYALALSYSRAITDYFSAGITVKYVREDIWNSHADGIAFDVGTLFTTPFYGVKFASMISNYGSKLQMSGEDLLIRYDADPQRRGNNETVDAYYKTDHFELPLKLQIGLSREFEFLEGYRLTIAVDATHPNDNAEYVNVGAELSLLDNLVSLRGGYKALFLEDNQEGLSLGLGVHYGLGLFSIGVDYAFQQYKFLGNTQTFGVMFRF